jgi:hypothetical protein
MQIVQELKTIARRGRKKHNYRYIYEKDSEPLPEQIFVFPSDLNDMNRKGIANIAVHKYGASYYQNSGPCKSITGRAYAIPITEDGGELTSFCIKSHIRTFVEYSQTSYINRNMTFFICDFSQHMGKYSFDEIAASFKNAYGSYFPESFATYLQQVDLSEITLCPSS